MRIRSLPLAITSVAIVICIAGVLASEVSAQDNYLLCTDWLGNINYIDVPDSGESFNMRQVFFDQVPYDGVVGRCDRWLAMGDFDNDGDQDFVVGVRDLTELSYPQQGTTKLYVYEKTGDGMTFASPVHLFTFPFVGGAGKPTAVDDFNNDGNLDFIIDLEFDYDRYTGPVQMFLGNGDLTFAPYQELNGINWRNGIVATDVDGDRTADLICSNLHGLTAGDFDGDGNIDVIEDGQRRFKVFLGNGDGTFYGFDATFWGTHIGGELGDWQFYRGLGNGNFQAGRKMSGNRHGYEGTRWGSPLVTFQTGGTDEHHIACNRVYYPIVQHYTTSVGPDANGIWRDSVTFNGDIYGGTPAQTGRNRAGLQSANIPIAPTGSPHPAVEPRQQIVEVGETAQFDGSGSYDTDDGSIVSYDWDYADGTTGVGVNAPHTYFVEGKYRVGLKTTDNDGEFRSAYAEVVAKGDPPVAVIDMPAWAPPNGHVRIFGDGSTDDFGVKLYYWDLGDGYKDHEPHKYANTGHYYKEAGVYTVTLTVYDAVDQTSTITATIVISDEPPPNTSPVADAGPDQVAECVTGDGTATITLDGSGSSDPDGDPLTYTWSGPFGVAAGVSPLVDVPIGASVITLTVEDDKGATDSDDVVVTVADTSPPTTSAAVAGDLGNNGWYVSPVVVTLEATDACADVEAIWFSLNGVPQDAPNPAQVTLTEGVHVLQLRATDQIGNEETTQELSLSVDLSGPEIVISGVEEGATYELGLVPEATYEVTDATSGVASSSATLTGGDEYGLGEFVYTVSAEDNAGNPGILSVNYVVIGGIAGMTALLDEYESSGDLDAQFAIGLRRSLHDALNAPNPTAQSRMLGDFINKVDRQTGKKITAEAAAVLIHAAEYIINENLTSAEVSRMVSSELIQAQGTPNQFELSQPYPNPFNPTTEIRFALPKASQVSLTVYNIMGQRVTTLVDGHLQEGWHTVSWDGTDSPSGMYFYRMAAGAHVATRKMVLLK